jgi:class 3 adenylate cyclase
MDDKIALRDGMDLEVAVLLFDLTDSTGVIDPKERGKIYERLKLFAETQADTAGKTLQVKNGGDGVLVICSAPIDCLRIASRLRGRTRLYLQEEGIQGVATRAGAAFGVATVSANCTELYGDAVTMAARVEAVAKERGIIDEVLCEEGFAEALCRRENEFDLQGLGIFELNEPEENAGAVEEDGKEVAKAEADKESKAKDPKLRNYGRRHLFIAREGGISSDWARRLTCWHQGKAFEAWFLASRWHRDLKDAVNRSPGVVESSEAQLDIVTKYNALLDDSVEATEKAARKTFGFLQEYFAPRLGNHGRVTPRICLIGFDNPNREKRMGTGVIDLVRDDDYIKRHEEDVDEAPLERVIGSNSGFVQVLDQAWFDNDLWALGHDYCNPRLNKEMRDKFLSARKLRREEGADMTHKEWADCWGEGHDDPRDCYRSTLIVPLTLRHNRDLRPAFSEKFPIDPKDARAVFGLLCFDHVDPHFFRDEDLDIGYVAADWLSLYQLTHYNYTYGSETFKGVVAAL